MGSTKIINVLKDDKFEELLDIVKSTDASEVVFVLPKKTKAFKSESQFAALENEIKKGDKSVAFLCSNSEVNELAKKYSFDVLSTNMESARPKKAAPITVPAVAGGDDLIDNLDEEDEAVSEEYEGNEVNPNLGQEIDQESDEPEEAPAEEEYKEEETAEEKPPYGTEMDESGNPVYEEEEDTGEEIAASNPPADFEIVSVSAKTRGMSDIIKPAADKNIKVVQKDKRPVKIETRAEEADIQSVWGHESSDNIWADISKPRVPKQSFFKKRGLNFNTKKFLKRGVVVTSVTLTFILVFIIFLTIGSARIEIKPRSQALNAQLKVTMSPNFSSVDNSFNRIPGQLFTISKSASNKFNATAEKDAIQKSRGIITIYNEYSTSSQPLVATTRFEYIQGDKESGFVFRTLRTVSVPGIKIENGVVTPGKIDVEVIADKAGQTYNIPAGDFGIMAWREKGDTARYEKIYGRSSDSMHGGILGKAKVVSEFDYNNAKDNLTAKVKDNINEALKAQSAGLELIANVETKIDSIESTAEIDDAADTFTMTVNSSITTIGYKKEDLMALLAGYVEKTSGLMMVPDKLELSYKDAVINPINNTLEVIITIGGNAYAKIDQQDIAANLMGKNELQIKDYLSSINDIDSAKVILSPFWVKKIPKNNDKIDISLTF